MIMRQINSMPERFEKLHDSFSANIDAVDDGVATGADTPAGSLQHLVGHVFLSASSSSEPWHCVMLPSPTCASHGQFCFGLQLRYCCRSMPMQNQETLDNLSLAIGAGAAGVDAGADPPAGPLRLLD